MPRMRCVSQKFANYLKIQAWPLFYDALPFCKIFIEIVESLQKLLIWNHNLAKI